MSIYSKSKVRDSEAAQILQEFIDNLSHEDFAKGFEYLKERLDDVADDVDKTSSELEHLLSICEFDINVYQDQISALCEQLEEQQ